MKLLNKQEKREHAVELAKRWGGGEKWVKHYERDEYVEVEHDGRKYYICIVKPSIRSEFWYDDEYESPLNGDPEHDKAFFIADNMRWKFKDFGIAEWMEEERQLEERGFCSGRHLDEPFLAVWPNEDGDRCYPYFFGHRDDIELNERCGMVRVPMTAKDREQLAAIFDAERERFRKRLEMYWKRYSDKVWACGYWANR